MKTFLYILGGSLLVLSSILIIRTFINKSVQRKYQPEEIPELSEISIKHFIEAIKIKTVSYDNKVPDSTEFNKFHAFLHKSYPLIDSILEIKYFNHYGIIYKWKGTNPDLQPIVLLAHFDVVPVSPKEWENPPFSGLVKDSAIWGRGTLDDKISVIAIMEAVEKLLNQGFKPERSVYISFGQDEEVSGKFGAAAMAEFLKSKKIDPLYILDEGLVVTDKIVPGLIKPAALIGIAEKGYLSLELNVKLHGGHSSMPEKETAISVLAKALNRLQENPMPARISQPVDKFLDVIAPEMPFITKLVFSNRWLFKPLITSQYNKSGQGRALVNNLMTPTILQAGNKENVVPSEARAVLNFRTLPGNSNAEMIASITKIIDDKRVEIIEMPWKHAPSGIASTTNNAYQIIEKSIKQVFPETIVAPSLVLATTDSRHYQEITPNIYRFLPVKLTQEDLKGIHGANEHISLENFRRAIGFYFQLIKNSD
jgi:carboxypeptidase PM20D1